MMNDYYSNPQSNPFPSSPYSGQNPPYSGENPAYPSQNPSYPSQNPAYPSQNPSYGEPQYQTPSQAYPPSPAVGTPLPQQPQTGSFPSTSSFPSYYTSGQPGMPPQPQKSRAKVVLIVVAVLMFAGAGVFAGLYVAAESDHDKATSVLEEKKAQLADVKKDITAAEDTKSTAEDHNSDIEGQNSALKPCVDATQHYLWDVNGAPDAERQAALDAMWDACT
jgi:hypothetical protein